jgi:hypothetical protein
MSCETTTPLPSFIMSSMIMSSMPLSVARTNGNWEGYMKTRYTVALSLIAGAALGGAAI